jgi:hypothetical protein
MAISPEVRPRVSETKDHEVPPVRATPTQFQREQLEKNSNSSFGYILGAFALIVAGYLAYTYYWPTTVVPTVTNQSTTTVTPPVAPPVEAPAPSATAPAAPATPPATPPATTTTP